MRIKHIKHIGSKKFFFTKLGLEVEADRRVQRGDREDEEGP
jgi:hypothetical protein